MPNQNSREPTSAPFGSQLPSNPEFSKFTNTAFYIPMRDGVKIAIDLFVPSPLSPEKKIPALILQTRYWRNYQLRKPFRWFLTPEKLVPKNKNLTTFFTSHGFAFLKVDVRGTGASFGVYKHPWAEESIEDAREIVNWVIQQPWSNGKVGGFGTSYGGTTAELLATLEHDAVKVVIPKFNHPDPFSDISHPGGLFNQRFIKDWHDLDWSLDNNEPPEMFNLQNKILTKGVKPVDNDNHYSLLNQAVAEHRANGNIYEIASQTTFRDDLQEKENFSMQQISVHRRKENLEKSSTHIFGWGSWFDAGTADAIIRRFLTFKNAGQAVIGAWNHGGQYHASPFLPSDAPVSPSFESQLNEMAVIFDHYLKQDTQSAPPQKLLHYYTIGEEKWHSTSIWPPEGMQDLEWNFSNDRKLINSSPEAEGSDVYQVNYSASSGGLNRWWEMNIFFKKTVVYPDLSNQEGKTLCYTSYPLESDLEISGYPVIKLNMKCSTPDAAVIVYLLDVAPNGRVTYISEGTLRLIHQKVSNQSGPYTLQVPYHSFLEKDASFNKEGDLLNVEFGLLPISALIQKGHCLRVAIAGHDKGTFSPISEKESPTFEVFFGENKSKISLTAKWRAE